MQAGRTLRIPAIVAILIGGVGLAPLAVASDYTSTALELNVPARFPVVRQNVNSGQVFDPYQGSVLGNLYIGSGVDAAHGQELWATDLNTYQSQMIVDMNPGPVQTICNAAGTCATVGNSYPSDFASINGVVYFATRFVSSTATDLSSPSAECSALWATNGTAAGTRQVRSWCGNNATGWHPSQQPYGFTRLGSTNKFIFDAEDEAHGVEVWISDGTSAGTVLLKDILPGTAPVDDQTLYSSNPDGFYAFGNKVIFWARDGQHDPCDPINNAFQCRASNLWASDGTSAGTIPLTGAINCVNCFNPFTHSPFYSMGTGFIFAASDGTHGFEPWVSDGTPAGTRMIVNLNTNDAQPCLGFLSGSGVGQGPFRGMTLNNKVLFQGGMADCGPDAGSGLWVTDGTAQGTSLVQSFDTASWALASTEGVVNGKAFFGGYTSTTGLEPWVTDGTPAGTFMLIDAAPGTYPPTTTPRSGFDNAYTFTGSYATRLIFTADDGVHGREPWITDGTLAGTQLLKDLNTAAGVGSNPGGFLLWNNQILFEATTDQGDLAMAIVEVPINVTAVGVSTGGVTVASPTTASAPSKPVSGTTYTANTGTWSSLTSKSLSYSYQWYSCTSTSKAASFTLPSGCTALSGATASTYTPSTATSLTLLVGITARIPGADARTMWSATFLTQGLPGAIGPLSVSFPKAGQATVAWSAITANPAVTAYEYRLGTGTTTITWAAWKSVKTATTVTLTNLRSKTAYAVQVRAVNSVGAGAASQSSFVAP